MLGWAAVVCGLVRVGGLPGAGPSVEPPPPSPIVWARREGACSPGACDGPAATPGREERLDGRGTRMEFALAMLAALDAEPISGVARSIALSGVQLDYVPPRHEAQGGRAGFGKVNLWVRLPLDAFSGPLWAASQGR